jgi:transposase
LVDAEGRPMRLELTPGQAHDGAMATVFLPDIEAGATLLADRAYDSDAIRTEAKARAIWANIPPKRNRKASLSFSRWLYRQRNLVERFFNRVKHYRGIATRHDKCPLNFLAAIQFVSSLIWIRAK